VAQLDFPVEVEISEHDNLYHGLKGGGKVLAKKDRIQELQDEIVAAESNMRSVGATFDTLLGRSFADKAATLKEIARYRERYGAEDLFHALRTEPHHFGQFPADPALRSGAEIDRRDLYDVFDQYRKLEDANEVRLAELKNLQSGAESGLEQLSRPKTGSSPAPGSSPGGTVAAGTAPAGDGPKPAAGASPSNTAELRARIEEQNKKRAQEQAAVTAKQDERALSSWEKMLSQAPELQDTPASEASAPAVAEVDPKKVAVNRVAGFVPKTPAQLREMIAELNKKRAKSQAADTGKEKAAGEEWEPGDD
jgi:hypothetical protein